MQLYTEKQGGTIELQVTAPVAGYFLDDFIATHVYLMGAWRIYAHTDCTAIVAIDDAEQARYPLRAGSWVDCSELINGYIRRKMITQRAFDAMDDRWPTSLIGWQDIAVIVTIRTAETWLSLNMYTAAVIPYPANPPRMAGEWYTEPLIDRYGEVVVAGIILHGDLVRMIPVQEVGEEWCAGGGESLEPLRLYGRGRYGIGNGGKCKPYPPAIAMPYDISGPMQGGECAPATKRTMARVQYVATDGLTLTRWCEIASWEDGTTQMEKSERLMHVGGENRPYHGNWHAEVYNDIAARATLLWRGFPVEEQRRIARGVMCSPFVLLDVDGEQYAGVLPADVAITYEDGGEMEIELMLTILRGVE